jgi:hypothetical protein
MSFSRILNLITLSVAIGLVYTFKNRDDLENFGNFISNAAPVPQKNAQKQQQQNAQQSVQNTQKVFNQFPYPYPYPVQYNPYSYAPGINYNQPVQFPETNLYMQPFVFSQQAYPKTPWYPKAGMPCTDGCGATSVCNPNGMCQRRPTNGTVFGAPVTY